MNASCANLAAAGLILAAGAAVFGATGAAAGLRAPVAASPIVSVWRDDERRVIGERGRRAGRDRRDRLDWFGLGGPTEGETPAAEEDEAPQTAASCPPVPALPRVAADFAGPRIIEVGRHAPSARRGPLPVVVYGDSLR
ncbi:MAG: hypothetical protein ABR878_07235 [Roseiarcus sp.]|jgi:hypothetical protein